MGSILCTTSSIEEDHRDIAKLLESAKFGRWDEVWKLVGSPSNENKSHMLNCVPENRRWTVLQQAVFWNNTEVVCKLLRFPGIDTSGKTKEGKSEIGEDGGSTALDIALKFNYKDIVNILSIFECKLEYQELDTYHAFSRQIQNQELGLLRLTVAAYKETFHPFKIDRSKPLLLVMEDIFHSLNTTERWKTVRDKLSQSVFQSCEEYSKKIKKSESREEFYKTIINVYTDENTKIYTRANTALRRQRAVGYRPTAEDLALGPYILVYQLLLMFWGKLKKEFRTTYRHMKLSKDHREKYKRGTKFTWMSFVSSSVNASKAKSFPTCEPHGDDITDITVFQFDNKRPSQWQPRNIESFAVYEEEERVYPAGSQFLVRNRADENGVTRVYLELLP